ncbi:DNA-binding protein [Spirochaetia bacterium]|nr:DNA-binding protein [Spirochaetia bacterium]
MKAVIDTNIIIDAIASRVPFNRAAEEILLLAAERKISAAITARTASDIYYLAKKYLKNAEQTIIVMKKLFTILDIITVDRTACIRAFDTDMDDYEDSLLAVCAKQWKADHIITRNKKDFVNSPVPALLPGEYSPLISHY